MLKITTLKVKMYKQHAFKELEHRLEGLYQLIMGLTLGFFSVGGEDREFLRSEERRVGKECRL